ncbi:MAG: hypothetical protein AAGA60_26245, partial [Cyanobacteria bacterium P01_E01_bin.42]
MSVFITKIAGKRLHANQRIDIIRRTKNTSKSLREESTAIRDRLTNLHNLDLHANLIFEVETLYLEFLLLLSGFLDIAIANFSILQFFFVSVFKTL